MCFKNAGDARQALAKFIEVKEEPKPEGAPVAGTGEQQSFDDEESAGKSQGKNELKLYVAPHMRKEFREHYLKLKTLRFKRTMAKHNLYFRGFQMKDDIDALKQELKDYFAQFGEVNNLHLMTKKDKEDEDKLVGFGFVSFKTLEGAQTAKYQAQNLLFEGRKLLINQFETKEQRIANFNERVDVLEFQRHLKYLENKRAMAKLENISTELQTEQG